MGVDLHADWIRISKAGQGDEPEFSGATLSALADGEIGIEDPNLLPVVGMRGDEDLVPLGLLVGVVGGARVKHDVEGDLPVAVVDVPVVEVPVAGEAPVVADVPMAVDVPVVVEVAVVPVEDEIPADAGAVDAPA